jgi:signal transduction histidine kinase
VPKAAPGSASGTAPWPSRLATIRNAAAPFVSALIVLALGLTAYSSTQREDASARLVAHTHAVLAQNQAVLARLADAETGERGFLITGDSSYLRPYRGAAADVALRLDTLKQLTSDNPMQRQRIDRLDTLARRRLALLEAQVERRATRGFAASRIDIIRMGGGRAVMDSVRRLVAAIEANEQQLLNARNADQATRARLVFWVVSAGTVVAAVLALLISLALSRYAVTQTTLARLLAERTEEAERANRVKAEFLANMSHDLRTPLNSIIGYIELLAMGIHGPVTPDQADDLQRIERSSDHLRALIDDVLDFARIEAGRVQLHIQEVSVSEVLAGLDSLVAPQAQAKQLRLRLACDPGLLVRADRERLDQILVNLVGNAIKFTPNGGSIDVECRTDDRSVIFDVRDTGDGIPAERLGDIFEPFVQVAPPAGSSRQGIGLGLAISRELVRAMNGDLTVVSSPGAGSTFTLRLPGVGLVSE